MSGVIIYQTADGDSAIEVHLEQETVWLSQAQMVALFERDQSVVSRHIRNVFKEGELDEKSNMQKMHIANSDRPVAFFSLDVIISVGYRVKSQRGTQFRQWATRILRDHLVQGYTLNQQRLEEQTEKFVEMQRAVELLSRTLEHQQLVDDLGKDVYPSIEEKAANLLYFTVKNHAFTDGNKRIAAAVFIYFLAANNSLYRSDGSKRLADNALVVLTLLIAETFFANFDHLADAPNGVKKLRELILQLAVQGKLVPQDSNDEPVSDFIKEYGLESLTLDASFAVPTNWAWIRFTDAFDIKGGSQSPKSQFVDKPQKGYVRLLQIRVFGRKPVPVYVPERSVSKPADKRKSKRCDPDEKLDYWTNGR